MAEFWEVNLILATLQKLLPLIFPLYFHFFELNLKQNLNYLNLDTQKYKNHYIPISRSAPTGEGFLTKNFA